MKNIILALLISTSFAADVKLTWDASPSQNVTNYTLYIHTNYITAANKTNCLAKINVGTNLTATADITDGKWYFAATATGDGLESLFSNVLLVEVPKSPTNMRTVILQYSTTLSNFSDIGFFKVKIP